MEKNIIRGAIAKIASISAEIELFCKDPESRCSVHDADMLERLTWKLNRQADALLEIDHVLKE